MDPGKEPKQGADAAEIIVNEFLIISALACFVKAVLGKVADTSGGALRVWYGSRMRGNLFGSIARGGQSSCRRLGPAEIDE
jgi:hypothetical protein